MSRDVLTVGSTMRILLLYRGEYSQWVERFMNYLKEQTDGEAMIYSIKNGDQPLPSVTQVSIAGTTSTEQPPLKDKSMWSDQEKRVYKIDQLLSDYDCEIRYHPGKANVVADALSRKERTRKEVNFINEDLHGMINKLEPRADETLCLNNQS
uniref:Putative reverse transcriptase domain-containing protein n=1 Tax=Tanacetum cinerariifolium TaxID=118510 RepID=A0A6L2MFA7_TANCI|nr:putative reverse transcriptase domain-containing protein [Tanacetum cinerariifolium]